MRFFFVSDLHLTDKTSGNHLAHTYLYEKFLSSLNKNDYLIFLGDIFDLLRTEYWFYLPLENRPWGGNFNLDNAINLFYKIINKNKDIIEIINKCEAKKIYIFGNHDRLCSQFIKEIIKVIDIENFSTYISYTNIYAEHGHRFDEFNYNKDDIPIGDIITTEIISKIPYTIFHSKFKHKDVLLERFKNIENVRPITAIVPWLTDKIANDLKTKVEIHSILREIIEYFEKIPKVKEILKKNKKLGLKVKLLLLFLKNVNVFLFPKIGKIYNFIDNDKKYIKNAYKLIKEHEYNYIIFGHTHNPISVPLSLDKNNCPQLYLNSGTWRKTFFRTKKDKKFCECSRVSMVSIVPTKDKWHFSVVSLFDF